MASRLVEWSILACFPAGIFLFLGAMELPSFVDPCHAWGSGGEDPQPTTTRTPEPSCLGQTSTHETKMQVVSRLLLFQGTTLLGLIVALVGAARERRLLVGVGAGILAAISLPLMAGLAFVFPLASAVLLSVGLVLFRAPPAARLRGPLRPAQQ